MRVCGLRQTLRGRPPFAPAYVRYTHRLQAFVEALSGRMTISDLAALTGLGWDTVKDIVKARLEKDHGHPRLKELKRLSIDEIYVGRRKKFYTLVIDLDTGRIVWVAHGRGGDTLRKFWRALRLSKARIEAVSMDMSPAYWSAVLEHLPEAAIVFDRFHITKLVNEKLNDLRREMVREATGPMQQTVKGVRYLLLLRRDNVDESRLCPSLNCRAGNRWSRNAVPAGRTSNCRKYCWLLEPLVVAARMTDEAVTVPPAAIGLMLSDWSWRNDSGATGGVGVPVGLKTRYSESAHPVWLL